MRLAAVLACAAALAFAPGMAQAAIVPGAIVDGPSTDIPSNVVQSDVAPDGTAVIAYLKAVAGVDHVWVSRLVNGAWSAPERVDTGLVTASSVPRIAVANGGKVVVTFVNATTLQAVVKPDAASPFGGPSTIAPATTIYGNVDLAAGGSGYVVYAQTNDVYAQRLEGTTFSPVNAGTALNSNPADDAGQGDGEARVATTADGAGAVATWAEGPAGNETIYARRLTGTTAGPALDAKLASLEGIPAAAVSLTMPDVDVDGAGTAWVAFRQFFNYGTNFGRAVVRPLAAGGTFGDGQIIDGLANPPTENVEYPRVDVNAAGQGLSANYLGTTFGVQSAALSAGTWTRGTPVNLTPNALPAFASPAIAESGGGLVAWSRGPGGMAAPHLVGRTTLGGFGPLLELSDPSLGPLQQSQVVASAGPNFAVVGYTQGSPAGRRIGAAIVDLPGPSGGGGGGPGGPTEDVTRPRLSRLRLSARRFRIGTGRASASAVKTGTTIRYLLSEAATVTLSFERVVPGRRVRGRCVKPKRGNRGRKACKRYVAVKPALKFRDQAAGQRRIRFEGRLSRRRTLQPGRYRLTLRARDAAGNRSAALRATVTLLPRKPKRR